MGARARAGGKRSRRSRGPRRRASPDAARPDVGVVGLGYVGLPLAIAFARSGSRVLGFDVAAAQVESLSHGESYIGHIPSSEISALVGKGRLSATADLSRLGEPGALLICVPPPLAEKTEAPDLSAVCAPAEAIGRRLRKGQLVVLESTPYPGTTEEVVRPILEGLSSLSAEGDFLLAYSPEREDPGDRRHTVGKIPKVVGGLTPEATDAAAQLYSKVAPEVVRVSSPAAAEATKMLENTYRAVNIALVNELKVIFERLGIDIWEVIEASATKPFGFQKFTPGPGWGGHCIPIDPFYLAWRARQAGAESRFIELAGRVNVEMPRRVVARLAEALGERGRGLAGAKILLLGVAYKRDIGDCRESPAFVLMNELARAGAVVSYHDPHVPELPGGRSERLRGEQPASALRSVPLTGKTLAAADAAVVGTDHSLVDPEFIVRHARLVVDTRNLTGKVKRGREKIVKA